MTDELTTEELLNHLLKYIPKLVPDLPPDELLKLFSELGVGYGDRKTQIFATMAVLSIRQMIARGESPW